MSKCGQTFLVICTCTITVSVHVHGVDVQIVHARACWIADVSGAKSLKKSSETYTVLQDPKNKHRLKKVLKDRPGLLVNTS